MLQQTGNASAKPQSVLDSQIGQIESRLKSLWELDSRISQSISRLINPRPAEVGNGVEGNPVSSTVEGRLQGIVRQLDTLQSAFQAHAETLDHSI